jgi:hypothetical protein
LEGPGFPGVEEGGGQDCSILPRGVLLGCVLLVDLGETEAKCSLLLVLLGGLEVGFLFGRKLPLLREGL